MEQVTLHDKEVLLRTHNDADLHSLVELGNDRDIWLNMTDNFPHPYTAADAERWLEFAKKGPFQNVFAIDRLGEFVGSIGFVPGEGNKSKTAMVGYWLGKQYWGQGIATRALNMLVKHVFASHDFVRLYADVYEWNASSARVLEKCGFTFEGRMKKAVFKDGKVIDELVYAIVR